MDYVHPFFDVCLFVRSFACLFARLLACFFVCWSACLLLACLFLFLFVFGCLFFCFSGCRGNPLARPVVRADDLERVRRVAQHAVTRRNLLVLHLLDLGADGDKRIDVAVQLGLALALRRLATEKEKEKKKKKHTQEPKHGWF